MAKTRKPLSPPKKCPCGFTTADRRDWHFHHAKPPYCDHYAQVLKDREDEQKVQE